MSRTIMSRIDKRLEMLLAMQDSDLCGLVWDRIIDHHGDDSDMSGYTEEEQVVDLVMRAYGFISNGGFQYLFESTFKGDPYYAKTAAAFEAIRARECAQALVDELSIFPKSKPPRNLEQRLKLYTECGGGQPPRNIRMRIGNKDPREYPIDRFYRQSPDILRLLANYIWENRATFLATWQ